jgi:hypothetical protein
VPTALHANTSETTGLAWHAWHLANDSKPMVRRRAAYLRDTLRDRSALAGAPGSPSVCTSPVDASHQGSGSWVDRFR